VSFTKIFLVVAVIGLPAPKYTQIQAMLTFSVFTILPKFSAATLPSNFHGKQTEVIY